uniref:C2H2-type domain-containing protein n=1 Tax=viral metagenome TaxID=1070528 RepID=A0A6C0BX78_9ZZZZ
MTTIELKNDDVFLKDSNTNLYTCATCSYYTPLKNSFIKHVKTDKHKFNINPIECGSCNKLFHTKISYNNHAKSCIISVINDPNADNNETICGDDDHDFHDNDDDNNDNNDDVDEDEDLSLLLKKFGNEYEKLMIKYVLVFFSLVKENILPVNVVLILVFLMWYH